MPEPLTYRNDGDTRLSWLARAEKLQQDIGHNATPTLFLEHLMDQSHARRSVLPLWLVKAMAEICSNLNLREQAAHLSDVLHAVPAGLRPEQMDRARHRFLYRLLVESGKNGCCLMDHLQSYPDYAIDPIVKATFIKLARDISVYHAATANGQPVQDLDQHIQWLIAKSIGNGSSTNGVPQLLEAFALTAGQRGTECAHVIKLYMATFPAIAGAPIGTQLVEALRQTL